MVDYIERQAAIAYAISGRVRTLPTSEDGENWIRTEEVRQSLLAIPSADVEPVRHGRWVEENPLDAPNCRLIKCSECGLTFIVSMNVPYEDWVEGRIFCYSCGARMDGEQDG